MNRVKLEGSASEQALQVPNSQCVRAFPSKHSYSYRNLRAGPKKELRDAIVRSASALHKINENWKEKMLEASDEVLKLLNKDYRASPHKRTLVHN
ncbi:hypothetical protein ACP70R_043389 [Stipagrostis hirtigluma subsp. patula]